MLNLSNYMSIKKRLRPLTLAVVLRDRLVPNTRPTGSVEVSLTNSERKCCGTASGAFAYLSLPDGTYTVKVESDFYLPQRFTVSIPWPASPPGWDSAGDADVTLSLQNNAVIAEVNLRPEVNYPFPSGATLVYGEVVKTEAGQNHPVPDATIHVRDLNASPPDEKELQFGTNLKGRFVLYMNKMTRTVIKEINGREFGGQKIGGERWIELRAVLPEGIEKARQEVIKDGQVHQFKFKVP
jgi:hypothetical protein